MTLKMSQPQTSDQLFTQFSEKLHSIAADLTRAYKLRHEEFHDHLSAPILRWLDFRLRYIDPQPRMVLFSDRFPKILPLGIEGAMLSLANRFLRGDDINSHQGRGLTDFDDISGKNRARRTDFLWADWAIHHLHLSPPAKGDGYAARSDWLLFCAVLENHVLFLDVLPHETHHFSNPELVETLFRNWPHLAERYKLVGMIGGNQHSAEEIAAARRGGVMLLVSHKGESYMGPGLGVSTASTPTRVMMTMDHCMHGARALSEEVLHPESQFRTESTRRGVDLPQFELALTERGLSIFERHSNVAWPLPRRGNGGALEYAGALHDNILPKWAMKCFV